MQRNGAVGEPKNILGHRVWGRRCQARVVHQAAHLLVVWLESESARSVRAFEVPHTLVLHAMVHFHLLKHGVVRVLDLHLFDLLLPQGALNHRHDCFLVVFAKREEVRFLLSLEAPYLPRAGPQAHQQSAFDPHLVAEPTIEEQAVHDELLSVGVALPTLIQFLKPVAVETDHVMCRHPPHTIFQSLTLLILICSFDKCDCIEVLRSHVTA